MNIALEALKRDYNRCERDVATCIVQLNERLDGRPDYLTEGELVILDMENKDRNRVIRDFTEWAIEQEKMEEEEAE